MSSLDDAQLGQVLAATIADQQAQSNAQHQKNIANINDLWSEKERNSALKNQNSAIEKQNSILAGRANRAEDELQQTTDKLNELERALIAHSLATDEAFQELMLEFYGTSPDKAERVKKDLAKFKFRTQQIVSQKTSVPKKPTQEEINWYIDRIQYLPESLTVLSIENLRDKLQNTSVINKLANIYERLVYWKNNSEFSDVPINKLELISLQHR